MRFLFLICVALIFSLILQFFAIYSDRNIVKKEKENHCCASSCEKVDLTNEDSCRKIIFNPDNRHLIFLGIFSAIIISKQIVKVTHG